MVHFLVVNLTQLSAFSTSPSMRHFLTALDFPALHSTIVHCSAVHCTALNCTLMNFTTLQFMQCNTVHCTALYCTELHCIALHCSLFPDNPTCTDLKKNGNRRDRRSVKFVYAGELWQPKSKQILW